MTHPPRAEKQLGSLLVVDDDEMNRVMLTRLLTREGYAVTGANDGAAALELVGKHLFDLVLLDIRMPGIDGLQVLKTLRKTRSVAELPIIMATAEDSSSDVVRALKLGANDYVTKPLDFSVVLARVRIDSSKIELMAYRCLIKNRTENLMRRSQIEEEVEFGVAPRIVDAYR